MIALDQYMVLTIDLTKNFIEAGFNVLGEFMEPVPVIGSVKYGSSPFGPVVQASTDVVDALRGSPYAKHPAVIAGTWLGVPGTSMMTKATRAHERGGSFWDVVLGRHIEKPRDKSKRRKTSKRAKRVSRF